MYSCSCPLTLLTLTVIVIGLSYSANPHVLQKSVLGAGVTNNHLIEPFKTIIISTSRSHVACLSG